MPKTRCPSCEKDPSKSGNNLNVYPDGHGYCHVCTYMQPSLTARGSNKLKVLKGNMNTAAQSKADDKSSRLLEEIKIKGEFKAFRGISEETCRKLNYQIGEFSGKECHIMDYGDAGQKLRFEDKKFTWVDRNTSPGFYNINNESLRYDQSLVIVEGEIDCLSVHEVGFQAVSVPDGAASIDKAIKHDYDKLMKFKEIVLFFDNDEQGIKAKEKAIELLPIEKLKIVDIVSDGNCFAGFKDANELLQFKDEIIEKNGLVQVLEHNIYDILPEGLIYGNQLDINKIKNEVIRSIPMPWKLLDEGMNGFEYGCLYLFLAGTSAGKTTVLRELAYYYRINFPELKIANFFLEENQQITPRAYAAIHNNVPLGKLRRDSSIISDDAWGFVEKDLLNTENLIFIDKKFKKTASDVLRYIRYLVVVKKFDLIIIDHLSYIIGRTKGSGQGERRDIDEFMYELQDLVQELSCIIIAVSHVNESSSAKRWDEGEVPNIYSGRGSKGLAQIPDGIIGLARNMVNGKESDKLSLYNLKNRWFSKLGQADTLTYLSDYGRLLSLEQLNEFFNTLKV